MMETKLVTSRQNPICAHLRKLASSGAYREETGEYLADGEKLWEEAVRWHAPIQRLVTTDGSPLTAPEGVEHIQVPPELMAYLSPMKSPQGALFTLERRTAALPAPGKGRYLALDSLQDPGNVGTIWRAADALGADGLFLLGDCADPFHPKAVRASMGALFRTRVARFPSFEDYRAQYPQRDFFPFLLDGARSLTLADCPASPRYSLIFGNESSGLPPAFSQVGQSIFIPQSNAVDSLNLSIAVALGGFAFTQRNPR